jgi:cell wall-associated NlpC family hydrolase
MSKITATAGVLLSVGLIGTFALPAYAAPLVPSEMTEPTSSTQKLKLQTSSATILLTDRLEGSTQAEIDSIIASESVQVRVVANNAKVAASYNGGGLLAAARAQIGVRQDCTAMVENALRMLGYSVGDLSPMGFALFGTRIDPSQAQPGDIMMRGSHVAVYAGNGVAVHGGFGGSTVETSTDGSPYSYAVIVRI